MTELLASLFRRLWKTVCGFFAWLLRYFTTMVTVATSTLLLTTVVVPLSLTVGVDWLGISTASHGASDVMFVTWVCCWLAAGTGYLFHEILERRWRRLLYLTALFAGLLVWAEPAPSRWQAIRMAATIASLPLGAVVVAITRWWLFDTDYFRHWWRESVPMWLRVFIAAPRGVLFAACCLMFAPILCELLPGLPPHLQSPFGIRTQIMAAVGL